MTSKACFPIEPVEPMMAILLFHFCVFRKFVPHISLFLIAEKKLLFSILSSLTEFSALVIFTLTGE